MTDAFDQDAVEAEAARWFFQNCDELFIVMRRGVIDWANPTWTKLLGWTLEETVGRPLTDFAHPDEEELIAEAIRRLQTQNESSADHRLRTREGDYRWFRSRSKRPYGGGALIVSLDITDERRRDRDREIKRRANELLRTAAGIFAWSFNPDTQIYTIDPDLSRPASLQSPATVQADGSRTMTRQEMATFIHPDDRLQMMKAFTHTVTTGEQQIVVYRHWSPEDEHWATLRAAWLGIRRLPSGKWEVFGITHDMTEVAIARDQALRGEHAAQQAAEAKAQFLANMSHEIRTPMNGVLGVLHLLKRESLSDDGRRLLDEALGCGSMLSELLNDIIDFSKIDAGRLELAAEAVDPAAVMAGVLDLLRPQAEAKGLYLRAVRPEALGWARLDPVRLRQVLFNLVGNAVKFTLNGGVEVRLTTCGEGETQRLRIEVEDTGVGIPLEAQATLFERFHQGDGSTTRRFGGSGLGLAITQRLARMMDGEVGFESRDGEGSLFWAEVAAPAAPAPRAGGEADGQLLAGLRVLVVEDNATNRLIATRMLEQLGATVQTADDGEQGVTAMAQGDFDLVFMDVQMPVMDGVEATRRIRAMPPPAGQAPIIAMTANAMSHQQASYITAGMNGAIAKPFSPGALISEIAAVLTARAKAASAAA